MIFPFSIGSTIRKWRARLRARRWRHVFSPIDAAPHDSRRFELDLARFSNKKQYDDFRHRYHETLEARWLTDKRLRDIAGAGDLSGWCTVCRAPTTFSFQTEGSESLREALTCRHCRLNARVRAAITLLEMVVQKQSQPAIYITEQATFAHRWLSSRYERTQGSEYYSPEKATSLKLYLLGLGLEEDSLRYEDVTALTFDSSSLDAVLSFEVLEHVPDYRAALQEFGRVLRRGGHLVLTVPFRNESDTTTVRASVSGSGEIVHHLEPEFHGDPLSKEGVLAFYNFGWDLLEAVRTAGFSRARWYLPWGISFGLTGSLWTLVARR